MAGCREVRRGVVRGFSYVVFYRRQPERLVVLWVRHARKAVADRPASGR